MSTTTGRFRNSLIALLTATSAACAAVNVAYAEAGTVIVKAGAIELGATDVRSIVAGLPDNSRKELHANLPAFEQLLRGEVVRRALIAEAHAKNFERDPTTLHQLERVQQEALTRLWLSSRATVPADYPTDADVKNTYEALKAAAPAEYHITQIFISAPDGAEPAKLTAALRKGTDIAGKLATADFAQLAREQSEDAETAAKGGDMGFIPGERLAPGVLKAIKPLNPGQVLGPVKTADGLHFIKLIETRTATLPPLAEVRERIVADLRARRTQQLEQSYLNDLSAKLGISINEIELGKLQAGIN